MHTYVYVDRKRDERDLHSECEFCMRQVRPEKYCKDNLLRARKVVSRAKMSLVLLLGDNRVLLCVLPKKI